MPTFTFLEASIPLAKKITLINGELKKQPYPNVKNFTSHSVQCATLKDFHTALTKHAALGHCLLKGTIEKALLNESRAKATTTDTVTQWACFDLDRAPFKTPQEFMQTEPHLRDVAYVAQYSASHGLPGSEGLSCHIFVALSHPYPAPYLKRYLMNLNMNGEGGKLRSAITLDNSNTGLHWPLDITCCQNDKLIYIAPAILGRGILSTLKDSERVQYVPGKNATLNIEHLKAPAIDAVKKDANTIVNSLRATLGIPPLSTRTRTIGAYEVLSKPGEQVITECWQDGDWMRFNINGGNSNAYYHPIGNFEIIHSFKDDQCFATKDFFPGYYKKCLADRYTATITPDTTTGELALAIRNRRTSKFHNILWNEKLQELEVMPSDSKDHCEMFLNDYGTSLNDMHVPTWTLTFNPQSNVIYDEENRNINLYVPSKPMLAERTPIKDLKKCPLIERIILSAVSGNTWDETTEHFLNWLACIFQYRIKTGTAWILHGTEGTGKQLLVNRIIRPLLGTQYVVGKRMSELEEKFSGWLECALIAFIDEVQVSASQRKDIITGDLKNFITDSPVSIRHMNKISYDADSYVNFILGSNMPDPVVLPKNDRRYNTGHFQHTRLRMTTKEVEEGIAVELPHFMNYIMQRKACKDTAAQIINTESRRAVIAANRNSIDMVADAINEGDLAFLWDSLPDMKLLAELHGANNNSAYGIAFTEIIKREARLLLAQGKPHKALTTLTAQLTRDELSVIFQHCIGGMPVSPNKFTRLLKHHKIETRRIRVGSETPYGIELTWIAATSWLLERRKELEPPKLKVVK